MDVTGYIIQSKSFKSNISIKGQEILVSTLHFQSKQYYKSSKKSEFEFHSVAMVVAIALDSVDVSEFVTVDEVIISHM